MGQGDSLTFGFEPALHRVFPGGPICRVVPISRGSLIGGKHHQSTHFVESGGAKPNRLFILPESTARATSPAEKYLTVGFPVSCLG